MTGNTRILGLFCCVAAAQLAVPAAMILRRETTLHEGRLFKFRTAPVDPYDAFRGRYVALSIEGLDVPVPSGVELTRNQRVYVRIEEGEDGFAKLASITLDRPDGDAYVQARTAWPRSGTVRLRVPFDRYYMDEEDAPEAERAYREHSGRGKRDAYVAVRVKKGFAVIEELYVGGEPIGEFVEDKG